MIEEAEDAVPVPAADGADDAGEVQVENPDHRLQEMDHDAISAVIPYPPGQVFVSTVHRIRNSYSVCSNMQRHSYTL